MYLQFLSTKPTADGMYDIATLPVRVVFTIFQVLGLVCTAWRICFRLRINRFWWEDAWAVVVLLSCLASLVGEWIYLLTYFPASTVGFWFYSLGFTSVVRAAHLSILFSITRIVRSTRLARLTYLYAACCGIFWTVIVSGKIWQCVSDPSWHHYNPPACVVKSQILIFEFTTDCVTVGILIALPLRMLWRVKLPTRQRRMILCIFASSVVLAFAAIFHIVGHVLHITILIVAGINSEIATSVIMCNLLVVVTYVYRFLWRDDGSSKATTASEMDSDDFTQPVTQPASPPLTLTTVEIDSSAVTTQQYTTRISAQDCSDSVHA